MPTTKEIRELESRIARLEADFTELSDQMHRLTLHVTGEMQELEEGVAQFKYGTDEPGQ